MAVLAVLGVVLTGLTVATGGGAATAATSCVDTVQPLGAATSWTEFVEGDGSRTSESEGSIAYGGNLPSHMTVGKDLTVARTDATLVIAGTHDTYNLEHGSAYVSPQSGVGFNGGGGYLATNPIDFPAAFTQLRATSTQWAAAAATGTLVEQSDVVNRIIVLRGTDPKLNVFTLTQAELTAAKTIAYDVPTNAAVLVNVRGTSVRITSRMTLTPGGAQPTTAGVRARGPFIWNFPEATSVTFNVGSDFGGHVIAPRADVVVELGVLVGQTVAKSFRSPNETHVAYLPASVCLPGPTTPPVDPEPARSDVTIAKAVSATAPRGGDQVTYTLTARNLGGAAATGVTVTDVLPAGVTLESLPSGCTVAVRTVTCTAGTLPVGGSKAFLIGVTAAPVAGAGAPDQQWALHELTPTKQEWQVDLEPGDTKTVSVSCPTPGAILSDGQIRIDHVDQGTGALTDVRVLRQETTGLGSWKAIVRNNATGRAQAKAFIVCLPPTTEVTKGHRHALDADSTPVTGTYTWNAVGRQTANLACPTGTVPIVPGFSTSGGAVRWAGSEPAGATGWRFTFDVAEAGTTVTPSMRCLRREVAAADGHTHDLVLQHVARTVTVPAGAVVEEQVICSDQAKGITATWSLPAGVVQLGNDPRLKARNFRLLNTTGAPLQAVLDLECLGDRPGPEVRGHDLPVQIDNTATVTSTSEDANPANNSASVTMNVQPGAVTATALAAASATRKVALLSVVSSMPGTGTVVVRNGRKVLAKGSVSLRAGGVTAVRVKLTEKGRKAIRRGPAARAVDIVIVPARGVPDVRRVVLRRR